MKHTYFFFFFLWITVSFGVKGQNVPKTEPGTLVFKLKPGAANILTRQSTANPLQETLRKLGSRSAVQKFPHAAPDARTRSMVKNAVDISLIYEWEYSATQPFDLVKKELLASGLVEYVEPLYIYKPLYVPNDPRAHPVTGSQNYLSKIKAYEAWDISKGDPTVVIGILDTGVRLSHEDLIYSISYNFNDPIDGIDNDKDGYVDNFQGWDMADNDNDPSSDANGHGTLVAGIAAATTDNGIGIAGVGFKCKFLPIKVFSSKASGSFRGFEGIVYAADQGCKVINLSWGGTGFASAFEQDIIDYAAINRNVVIVSAAGNTNQELDFYPASYRNVLSVGSVGSDDVKFPSHTFSYAIKIAAQGGNVFTTGNNDDTNYGNGTGSSYATPMVSGAAALVRSHFPSLTAAQVVERLRVTADDIYNLPGNKDFIEKLGRGRLNVFRALSEVSPKSVRLQTWKIENEKTGRPGEVLDFVGVFRNFLSPVSSLTVSVTSPSPYLSIQQGQFAAGSMGTLTDKSNQGVPFKILVSANTPANAEAVIRFGFTDGTYTDYQYIRINLNPDFVTTNVNNVMMSVLSRGNVAYDGMNLQVGNGFKYKGGNPILPQAGLLIGYSPTLVSDNIRNEKGTTDRDFYAVTNIVESPNPMVAPFEASNIFQDSLTATKTKSLQIKQNVYAWSDEPNKNFVLLEYELTNRTTQTIMGAFAGMYADWDLFAPGKNVVEWNNDLKLSIIRHYSDTSIWVGIQALSRGATGFYGFENSLIKEGAINIADGFSTAEKYNALSGGVRRVDAGQQEKGADVSYTISTAIKALAPTEKDTVAFAFVAGDTRVALYQHATAAQVKYQAIIASRLLSSPSAQELSQLINLYPNPSSGAVSITLPSNLSSTPVTVILLDSQGKTVSTSTHAPTNQIDLDLPALANGLYMVRISAKGQTFLKKLLISK